MKFNVGDKVRIHGVTDHRKVFNGKVVVIKRINPNGETTYKKGITHYSVGEHFVFWENELEPVTNQKIVITSDGTETLARLYDGNKVIKTATAKCSPDDTFDFKMGAMLAFDRLMNEGKKKPDEPPKYYNGKVVCVSNENEPYVAVRGFTVGKVYTITDGIITNDTGWSNRDMFRLTTLEHVCCYLGNKFIPLVE